MSHLNPICLVSGKAGAGKSFFALHLACLMAKCKSHVLLVDMDCDSSGLSDFFSLKHPEKSHDWEMASCFLPLLAARNPFGHEFEAIIAAAARLVSEYEFLDKETYGYLSFIPCHSSQDGNIASGITLSINLINFLLVAHKMGYEYVIFDGSPGFNTLSFRSAAFSNSLIFFSESDRISENLANKIKKEIIQENIKILESLEIKARKDISFKSLLKDWQRFIKIERQQQILIFNRHQEEIQRKLSCNQWLIFHENKVAQSYDKGSLVFPRDLIENQKIMPEKSDSPYIHSVLEIYRQIVERYGKNVEELDSLEEKKKSSISIMERTPLTLQFPLSEDREENVSAIDLEMQRLRLQNQEMLEEYQHLKEKYEEILVRNQSLELEYQKCQEELEHSIQNQKEASQEYETLQKEYQKLYEKNKALLEKQEQQKKQESFISYEEKEPRENKEISENIEIQKLQKEYQTLHEEYIAQTMAYHELEQEYNRLVIELNAWRDKLYEIRQNHGTQKLVRDVLNELEKISFKQ